MVTIGRGEINGYLVQELFSCPLKLRYLLETGLDTDTRSPYRSAVKLQLSRVLDLSHPGALHAGRRIGTAIARTRQWIQSADDGGICGAVLVSGRFRSRIPLMVRKAEKLTVYQVHGRLWKSDLRALGPGLPHSTGLLYYLREAAYRKWLLEQCLPEAEVECKLCFPSPSFRSGRDHLFERVASGDASREMLQGLLREVDATAAVESLMKQKCDHAPAHPVFDGLTYVEQMERLIGFLDDRVRPEFRLTGACRSCHYRQSDSETGFVGCWSREHAGSKREGRHIYELIGQGNGSALENGQMWQRQVPLSDRMDTFDRIRSRNRRVITIEQRRALQLLGSRGEKLPAEWMKGGLIERVKKLVWPLHFIDFEASSSPVPLFRSDGVYDEVPFQFSCHTLTEDGRVYHSDWLDTESGSMTRQSFLQALLKTSGLAEGTLVHYSPYEQQALNRLCERLEGDDRTDPDDVEALKRLIRPEGSRSGDRFVDLGRLVGSYYFNASMSGGLGLKDVLPAVLSRSFSLAERFSESLPLADMELEVSGEKGRIDDPHDLICSGKHAVEDGPSAMYAWLAVRGGLVGDDQRREIQFDLRRYCAADSLAMLLIFCHWLDSMDGKPVGEDLLIWKEE